MEFFIPRYRRDPNARVESLYSGVSVNGATVTAITKPSADGNRMETVATVGPAIPRGQGGRIAILVLGGMETTLDEVEYILEAKRLKKFVPRRGPGEIADMCRLLLERRNDMVRQMRRNPSERPRKKRTVRFHLPVGYSYVQTREPGLKVLARI